MSLSLEPESVDENEKINIDIFFIFLKSTIGVQKIRAQTYKNTKT